MQQQLLAYLLLILTKGGATAPTAPPLPPQSGQSIMSSAISVMLH